MTSHLKQLRGSGFKLTLGRENLRVTPPDSATEEHRSWIAANKAALFDELMEEQGWERVPPEEVPPGLPEDEEFWEREPELGEFQPTYQYIEAIDPNQRWLELQVAYLKHHLTGSLVRKSKEKQRSNAAAARFRTALKNWREREVRVRDRLS